MDDKRKAWLVRHEGESHARHVMGAVLVMLLACALGTAVMLPFLYTFVCNLRGC